MSWVAKPLHSRLPEREKNMESILRRKFFSGQAWMWLPSPLPMFCGPDSVLSTHNCKEGSVPKRERKHCSQSWWHFYCFSLSLKASTELCATLGGGAECFLVPSLSPWDQLFASGLLGVKTMLKKSLHRKLHGSKNLVSFILHCIPNTSNSSWHCMRAQ